VSIVTASFNSEKTISGTIQSVLNQSFQDYEYLIIDGLSADRTVEIIRSFEPEFESRGILFSWISEKDSGIYDAWNKALERATGKWISFVGSDDVLLPEALNSMAATAQQFPDCDFISAKAHIMQGEKVEREFGQEWNWNVFRREMKILHAAGWHNISYFEKLGYFDDSFKIVGDYEMLLRAGARLNVKFVDKFIIEMGGDGVSSQLVLQSLREVLRAKKKNQTRNVALAYFDFFWVYFKIKIKTNVLKRR
jgi:glycosyltransferase involved in cell wall biosynthesis